MIKKNSNAVEMSKQEVDLHAAAAKQDKHIGPAHIHVWYGLVRAEKTLAEKAREGGFKTPGKHGGAQDVARCSRDQTGGRHCRVMKMYKAEMKRIVYRVDDEQMNKAMAISLGLEGAQRTFGRAPRGELQRQLSSWLEVEDGAGKPVGD